MPTASSGRTRSSCRTTACGSRTSDSAAGGPRNEELYLVGTDAAGCTETLSTFTTGPWGSFDETVVYDGLAVRIGLPDDSESDVRILFEALGDGFPVFTRVGGQWASVVLDNGEPPECFEPTTAANGGVANGVLFVTGLNGSAIDHGGLIMDWVDVSFDALVDESTGRWDRVSAEGHLDLGNFGDSCGLLYECVACPGTGVETCIDLEGVEFVAEPLAYTWQEPTCVE